MVRGGGAGGSKGEGLDLHPFSVIINSGATYTDYSDWWHNYFASVLASKSVTTYFFSLFKLLFSLYTHREILAKWAGQAIEEQR